MRTRWLLPLLLIALLAAGCSGDAGPSPTTLAPTSGPSVTVSLPGLLIDVGRLTECLDRGGVEVEVQEEPSFEATAEVQVTVPIESGGVSSVGVFVYDSADDATAARPRLDAALSALGEQPSQQFANVLVEGLDSVSGDSAAQEAVGVLVICLGGAA
jgi:hypothetical protein